MAFDLIKDLIIKQPKNIRQAEVPVEYPLQPLPHRQPAGVQIPIIPKSYYDLYSMAETEIITRTCIRELGNQIFRRGIEVTPKFWGKCAQCEKEYSNKLIEAQHLTESKFKKEGFTCPDCETGKIKPPDQEQKKKLEKFVLESNSMGQTLEELCRIVEDDFQIADDVYLIMKKAYFLSDNVTNINDIEHELMEVIRGDPAIMRVSSDERGRIGYALSTCFIHRDFTVSQGTLGTCPKCKQDTLLFPVYYVATTDGGRSIDFAFIKGEVVKRSKYRKGRQYGLSPIVTIWPYAKALLRMVELIADFYGERSLPSGILFIPTKNKQGLKKMVEEWRQKTRADPNYKGVFPFDPENGAKPEFLKMLDTLEEMQFVDVRNELRLRIGALYGVEPIFQGDMTGGGGLNNEGLQITVTNRVVSDAQMIWNKHIFPRITEAMNVTDWEITLPPSEEEDEVAEHERFSVEIANAQQMLSMNFDVELTPDRHFIFSGQAKKEEQAGFDSFSEPSPQPQLPTGGSPTGDNEDSEDRVEAGRSKRSRVRERGQNIAAINKGFVDTVIAKTTINDLLASDLYKKLNWRLQELLKSELEALNEPNPPEDKILEALGRFTEQGKKIASDFAKRYFLAIYRQGKLTGVSDDLRPEITIDGVLGGVSLNDPEAMEIASELRTTERLFVRPLRDFTESLRSVVEDSFRGGRIRPTIDIMVAEMQNIISTEIFRLERVARSESQRFMLAGRERQFTELRRRRSEENASLGVEPEEDLFIWSIREDDRTSEQCKEIVKRVNRKRGSKAGVTLEELKRIAIDVQNEMNGPTWEARDWLIHPNCRSKFLRVV